MSAISIRRNIADGDLAFFTTWCPAGTGIDVLVSVAGHRWAIEESFDPRRGRIVINQALFAAYQAASSPHSIRALRSDLEAFDRWCRRHSRIALPATPEVVADYLDARAGQGSKPASLGRYKASIAKLHQLLELKDPTPASLVKLRLQAIRRRLGTAQKQARPLRFKGPVRNVERDAPRGLNVRALLESCAEGLPGLRDRALLSAGYDTGLRASELVAIVIADIIEAIDPDPGC